MLTGLAVLGPVAGSVVRSRPMNEINNHHDPRVGQNEQVDSAASAYICATPPTNDNAGNELAVFGGNLVMRRSRGANGKNDGIWTRNHAICTMGVICDVALGGYSSARTTTEALKLIRPAAIADVILETSPWLLNASYLNFHGLAGLELQGLRKYFKSWVANRVYHFYRYPDRSEHPVVREKCNLREVYPEFYDVFSKEIASESIISEPRAEAFWRSVGNRVPFRVVVA